MVVWGLLHKEYVNCAVRGGFTSALSWAPRRSRGRSPQKGWKTSSVVLGLWCRSCLPVFLGFALSFLYFGRHCSSCCTLLLLLSPHHRSLITVMGRALQRSDGTSVFPWIFTGSYLVFLYCSNKQKLESSGAVKWPQVHPWSSNAFQDTVSLSQTQLCHYLHLIL